MQHFQNFGGVEFFFSVAFLELNIDETILEIPI